MDGTEVPQRPRQAHRAGGPGFDLVASKLRHPLTRPGTVRRSPLIGRLTREAPRPIVSVAAPAGYGKTTLLERSKIAGPASRGGAGRERLARYSLTGPENQAAVDAGLAGGAWFRSAVPRKRMKELMKRSDYPAVRDTVIWIGLILLFGAVGTALWLVWHSWWAVP
jgi:hypothetical protein